MKFYSFYAMHNNLTINLSELDKFDPKNIHKFETSWKNGPRW